MTEKVELRLVNYILFGVFVAIVLAIGFGLIFIILARIRIQKRYAKEKEAREQKFSVCVDTNGGPEGGKKNRPRTGEGKENFGNGGKENLGLDLGGEKKRDAANNGSTTRVIKLEPALGSGILRDTSTTPV